MSTISLRLPQSLHKRVSVLSHRDQVSINQFITTALAEKISSFDSLEYLNLRAKRGSRNRFKKILAKVRSAPVEEHDRI